MKCLAVAEAEAEAEASSCYRYKNYMNVCLFVCLLRETLETLVMFKQLFKQSNLFSKSLN